MVDVKFTKLKNGAYHEVPAVFDIYLEDIELFEKPIKVIKPYGIVAFMEGKTT